MLLAAYSTTLIHPAKKPPVALLELLAFLPGFGMPFISLNSSSKFLAAIFSTCSFKFSLSVLTISIGTSDACSSQNMGSTKPNSKKLCP